MSAVTTDTGAANPTPRQPARGRPRGFDRDRALQAALEEFWAHGYEATPISTLAKRMGIGAPSLYAAFGDKKTLFREVVDVYSRTHGAFTARALEEENTARAAVSRMLWEAAAEYTAPHHPPGCLVVSAATNCGPDSADVEQLLRDRRNANIAVISRRIQDDVDAGILPTDTDSGALARLTGVAIQGMSQQARDGATRSELETIAVLTLRAWPAETAGHSSPREQR
ncbi:TetR/AcrR family transcriptional regulator [Cryptosporangium minutisporangium]|uniref:TetR/AcrR family transcriptional regulator n=1 Tax=Cryptosporangium minutisporangium TaxID=113569 RepID=A0ABP6T3D0_9ACTN